MKSSEVLYRWHSLATTYQLECFQSAIFLTGGLNNANKGAVDRVPSCLAIVGLRSSKQRLDPGTTLIRTSDHVHLFVMITGLCSLMTC